MKMTIRPKSIADLELSPPLFWCLLSGILVASALLFWCAITPAEPAHSDRDTWNGVRASEIEQMVLLPCLQFSHLSRTLTEPVVISNRIEIAEIRSALDLGPEITGQGLGRTPFFGDCLLIAVTPHRTYEFLLLLRQGRNHHGCIYMISPQLSERSGNVHGSAQWGGGVSVHLFETLTNGIIPELWGAFPDRWGRRPKTDLVAIDSGLSCWRALTQESEREGRASR